MGLRIWLRARDYFRFLAGGKPQEIYERFVAQIFRPVTGSAALILEDGELLAVRKNDFYMLPGGSPEPGEILEETAVREVKEETGFDVEIESYLGCVPQEDRGPVAVFHAEITGGEQSGSLEGEPEFLDTRKIPEENWRFGMDTDPILELIERI